MLKAHPKEKKQLDDLRAKMTALRPAGFGGGGGGGGGRIDRAVGDSTQAVAHARWQCGGARSGR